jgi:hypothetical protein
MEMKNGPTAFSILASHQAVQIEVIVFKWKMKNRK